VRSGGMIRLPHNTSIRDVPPCRSRRGQPLLKYLLDSPALSIVQDVDAFRAAYERGLCAAKAGRPAEAIQAFEEARACYVGDYLADPYEEWASSSRMTLQDRWLNVLEQLGTYYSQARTWEPAIACYCELLAVDGYREDIYRLLMRCYAACGRLADVKQTYLGDLEHRAQHTATIPTMELLSTDRSPLPSHS